MIHIQPVTLGRDGIVLEPLSLEHEKAVAQIAADGELWNLWFTGVPRPEETKTFIETALKARAEGTRFAWIVLEKSTGQALGCTSYHDIIAAADRVEIGYTFYRKSRQRSAVNTICKLMLMQHAFDTLGCAVVGWRTDIQNHRSQRAIERLGAKREGVLLHHALRRDGTARDTVMYSLLKQDWPQAQKRLEARLALGSIPSKPIHEPDIDFVELNTMERVRQAIECKAGALGDRTVASNAGSIAQASVTPSAWLRGVQYEGKIIGLILLADPSLGYIENEPQDVLWLWRLMIDFSMQHRGFGSVVMQKIIAHARTRPGVRAIQLSYVPVQGNAQPFYQRAGFSNTGKVDNGEHEMRLDL
jgi:N-acetyltransferase